MATEGVNVTPPKEEAPAEAKAPQSPETEEASDEISEDIWGDLANDEEPESGSVEEPSDEPEASTVEEPPAEPEEPAAAPEEPEEPEQPKVAETPAEPSVEAKEEPRGQEQPVDLEALWGQRQQSLTEAYKMSSEEGTAFLENPETELPRQMARMQVTIERTIMDNLQQALPQHVNAILEANRVYEKLQDAFFQAWPALASRVQQDPNAASAVQNMRTLFRQHNPQISEEVLIQQVGAAASIALGIAPQEPDAPAEETPPAPPPPPRPAGPRGSSPSKAKLGQIEQFDEDLRQQEAGSAVVF